MQTVSSLNFSALTAFSEDDADAAHSIIQTFIEETGKNADRMQQALAGKEVDGIAAMAHTTWAMFFRGDRWKNGLCTSGDSEGSGRSS